jgi:hypothetical protein
MNPSKHKTFLVKNKHYKKFIKENNTDKFSRFIKIWCPSKSYLLSFTEFGPTLNEEIFESLDTNYIETIIDNIHSVYYFETKSLTKYRLDIFKLNESNMIVNHIGFSLANKKVSDSDGYEEETNKHEAIELFSRIIFILNDLISKNKINNEFCIGGSTFEKKNILYKNMLKYLVGPNGFQKKDTNYYPDTDWGVYFQI